ncbi:MAG: hypothetical protein LAO09_08605 [Acidobacteriia bacterium]|nr:hypothetical protein [Terriglobia bacterium]
MAALPVHVSANVWVGIRDDGVVEPYSMAISRKGRHEVEWFCTNQNQTATVTFIDTPFQDKEFHVPAGGSACSGPVLDTGQLKPEYTYKIRLGSSTSPQSQPQPDAGIIIIRP